MIFSQNVLVISQHPLYVEVICLQINDMQTSPLPPFKSGPIGIKDAKCAEAYEKQFSNSCDFYFFEI